MSKDKRNRLPLVFIIAGLGGSHLMGPTVFLGNELVKSGYNVITISSPFNRYFTALASSSGVPGLTSKDAIDMYNLMKKSLNFVKIKLGINPLEISLAGYSLGALEAAFIAKHDSAINYFNFEKVVMINSPVNLLSSSKKIDDLSLRYIKLGKKGQARLTSKVYNLVFKIMDSQKDFDFNEDFFMNLDKISPFSNYEIKALIGMSFLQTLSESLFYSELINDFGLFDHNLGLSPQPGLRATQRFSYYRYYSDIVFKRELINRPKITFESLLDENSIPGVANFIKNSKNIYLMHNEDDFIINKSELLYLSSLYPEDNKFIYPLGGHVGNIWFKQNIVDFVGIFKSKEKQKKIVQTTLI